MFLIEIRIKIEIEQCRVLSTAAVIDGHFTTHPLGDLTNSYKLGFGHILIENDFHSRLLRLYHEHLFA